MDKPSDEWMPIRVLAQLPGKREAVELNVYVKDNQFVIPEQKGLMIDDGQTYPEEIAHNCDWMGCGTEHVVMRFTIQER